MDPHSPEKSLPKKNYPEISPENSLFLVYCLLKDFSTFSGEFSGASRASTIYQHFMAVLSTNFTKTSQQELLAEASSTMY